MSLDEIKTDALRLKSLRDQKEKLNEQLKDVNLKIRDLEEFKLNSMMNDLKITDVTVDNVHIKKGTVFRGGVTSHTDKEAFQYLFDSHNEGALKQVIMINLAKYPNIPELLSKLHISYDIQYSIHHMTLSSILKELVLEGKLSTSDFEKYSIYAQPQIKVDVNTK